MLERRFFRKSGRQKAAYESQLSTDFSSFTLQKTLFQRRRLIIFQQEFSLAEAKCFLINGQKRPYCEEK